MEREIERTRSAEPNAADYAWVEGDYLRWRQEQERLASLPRVLKGKHMPWIQGSQSYLKRFTGGATPTERLGLSPIYTLNVMEQIFPPGGRSGNHRHFTEAYFYILEGKGYEVHDGVRYDWEAGDVMCVPTYCAHQHFADESTGGRMFYCVNAVFRFLGLGHTEFLELHPGFTIPPGATPIFGPNDRLAGYRRSDGVSIMFDLMPEPVRQGMTSKLAAERFPSKVKNNYDAYRKQWVEENLWRQQCAHVIKGAERAWEQTAMGRVKYLVHPIIPSGLRTFESFLLEIPPGGRSGKHRHVGEEVLRILEGHGYDVQDGTRYDWEEQDVVCIPSLTVHQHFNADSERPVRLLSLSSRMYSYVGHGGIEHLENASPA